MTKPVTSESKKKEVKCSHCAVPFDPSQEGVVGQINGKRVCYCKDCCRGDY